MIRLLTFSLLLLVIFSSKSQGNLNNIDLMLLEKAPVTTYKSMNAVEVSTTVNSKVIKKTNAFGGDTFLYIIKINLA